jgi:cytochrome c oxidase subunit 2
MLRGPSAIEVVAVGHRYWWEHRSPDLNVVNANELHVLVSDPANPSPTFMMLISALLAA